MARRKDPASGSNRNSAGRARRRRAFRADDELVADAQARAARRQGCRGEAPAQGAQGPSRAPRRSLLGRFFRGIFYWGFVLCLWVGIAGAGLVAYYAAELPGASEWRVPDRPPNIQILAVDGAADRQSRRHGRRIGPHRAASGLCAERRDRHRGPPLPLAFRRRSGRARSRRREERLRRRRGGGRLDADPAARQEHVPDAGALAEAQGAGGHPRRLAGDEILQGRRSWRCI